MAMVVTAAMTIGLSLYACTTSVDVTICGGLIWILDFSSIGLSLCFFTMAIPMSTCGLGFVCVALSGFYIIYDTQLIMGGKRMELSIDDYVIAVMILYIDIIRLFLDILAMF